MKLSHLTEIVKNMQQILRCPKCGKHFVENSVDVVDITGDRGLVSGHCRYCNSVALVSMNVREFRQKINNHDQQVQKVATEKISPADVVEMKKFLNSFNGNFKEIIHPKDSSKKS